MKNIFTTILLLSTIYAPAQKKPSPITVTGTAGVTYEGYGLTTNPSPPPTFYTARKPWNVVRFNFSPTVNIGKVKLPFNFNFSPMRNNFGSVPFGFGSLPGFPKQTLGQWLTNPINNLGVNPTYKWAELQLGTQYLNYSNLSTGDIGVFGYGFSLTPSKYRFKFFRGVSQQAYQPYTGAGTPPPFVGAYKRVITMAQIGLEKEGEYFAGFNIVKGKDVVSSIPTPLALSFLPFFTPKPEENLIISFNTKVTTKKGWYGQTELATTITNRDATALPSLLVKDFKPLIKTNASSYRDYAIQTGFGKKGKDWDIGASMKWLGAGYNTMGYPFTQNDRLEYTVNTKFNAFKKKSNIVASIGQRFSNWSNSASRTKQIIANVNVFTQFNEHFSMNANYNNFGFSTPALLGGIKNVGNDLGIGPTYTWSNSKMTNLISLNYNWSKYSETMLPGPVTTNNNTHTAMLLYAPTFFNKPNLTPDFTAMYFKNHSSVPTDVQIISISSSLGYNIPKKKLNLRGQLQFNTTKINAFTPSKNLTATFSSDYKLTKKLTWNTTMTANGNKYGDELSPPASLIGATYLESTLRTGLQYRFGK